MLPSIRGLSRVFWTLWVGALINRIGSFVLTFLALFLAARGLSPEMAGATVSTYGAGSLLAGPAGGALADRLGRRPTMLLSLTLGPAALLHLLVARAPWHIALAAGLYGFCADVFRPANQAMMADVVPEADRARAFGLYYWVVNLGFSVAATVGGALARHGYTLLFCLDAATTLVFAAVVYFAIPETHPARAPEPDGPGAGDDRGPRDQRAPSRGPPRGTGFAGGTPLEATAHGGNGPFAPLGDSTFVVFLMVSFLINLVFDQFFVALPLDMRAHGVAPEAYGAMMSLNGLLIITLQPLALPHLGRVPRSRVLAAGAALIGLGYGVNVVARTPPLYLVGIATWTLGEIIQTPLTFAIVADLAPRDQRGRYQGLFSAAWGAALILSPSLGSAVLQRLGAGALWGGCLVIGLAGAALHLLLGRARGQHLARMRGVELAMD